MYAMLLLHRVLGHAPSGETQTKQRSRVKPLFKTSRERSKTIDPLETLEKLYKILENIFEKP